MQFKVSRHVKEMQASSINLDEDFILECAATHDRMTFKENHPHQFELQKDLPCGWTLAMAVDPARIPETLFITTVYPKGITRAEARTRLEEFKNPEAALVRAESTLLRAESDRLRAKAELLLAKSASILMRSELESLNSELELEPTPSPQEAVSVCLPS